MIISKTPVRISFFGGGTDYPTWLENNVGAVISTTINKYIFLSCRKFPPFFDYNINLNYSVIEKCCSIDEIKHPSIKGCLSYMNILSNIEINHSSDIPGRSGLGSSSAFTAGLLNVLSAYKGEKLSKLDLAKLTVHVEQDIINENVGYQDQYATAIGGFNHISFRGNNNVEITPIALSKNRRADLLEHLMLFHTKKSRIASNVVKEQIRNIPKTQDTLKKMLSFVNKSINILISDKNITEFGNLLHENWLLKRSLSSKISDDGIDDIYLRGLNAGAIGGKLLGAGAGGCMLLFVKPEFQNQVKEELNELTHIPFKFDTSGSKIIFYSSE